MLLASRSQASAGFSLAPPTALRVGQLQGMARVLGINLSRLVRSHAEEDGCENVEGAEASAADPGQTKVGRPRTGSRGVVAEPT